MTTESYKRANEETHQAWETNASFWDEKMGEGNDWVEVLVWPSTRRLLQLQPGDRVLDIACGNGLYARKLAAMGMKVLAFDFSQELIKIACAKEYADVIDYRVVDATDQEALLALGENSFDAAVCNMALFDMADIDPLMRTLPHLLLPKGYFVISVMHPCFNNPHTVHVAEEDERDGEVRTTYSIKVPSYMSPAIAHGSAIKGQPQQQVYFHRSLQDLVKPAFEAGFVIDALEERAFPPGHQAGNYPLSWSGNFSEIPPVMIVRMRAGRIG
jgi:2-polyprenyl-3-methyl-5-hydroxy-6-metoxy-1,4-benzoquinol methylase